MIQSNSKMDKIYKKNYVNYRLFRKSKVYRRIRLKSNKIIRDYLKVVKHFEIMGFTKKKVCVDSNLTFE